ncbi:hypothetical protein TNCV_4746471 [Trichonephila clavipes]|nr:hypothetical protein TNCV_4746471 [Trichonephila clavipes]
MICSGIGDQPVNKKDLMQARFEYLLNKLGTKENGTTALTLQRVITVLAEVKSGKTAKEKRTRDYCLLKHCGIFEVPRVEKLIMPVSDEKHVLFFPFLLN